MNKAGMKTAREAWTKAAFQTADGKDRDMSKLKKAFKAIGKVLVGIGLMILGYLFGEKAVDKLNQKFGTEKETFDPAPTEEEMAAFMEVALEAVEGQNEQQ